MLTHFTKNFYTICNIKSKLFPIPLYFTSLLSCLNLVFSKVGYTEIKITCKLLDFSCKNTLYYTAFYTWYFHSYCLYILAIWCIQTFGKFKKLGWNYIGNIIVTDTILLLYLIKYCISSYLVQKYIRLKTIKKCWYV